VKEENKVLTDVRQYNEWLSEPKVTSNRLVRVKIFFTAIMVTPLHELVQNQMEFLQNERIKKTEKRTGNEHTSRVGYLVGPIVD